MRKVYEKPSLVVEQFCTEDILVVSTGAFNKILKNSALTLKDGTEINIGAGQVLQSMDYSLFKKKN